MSKDDREVRVDLSRYAGSALKRIMLKASESVRSLKEYGERKVSQLRTGKGVVDKVVDGEFARPPFDAPEIWTGDPDCDEPGMPTVGYASGRD